MIHKTRPRQTLGRDITIYPDIWLYREGCDLFIGACGRFSHEGFIVPAPIEDIEDEDGLLFFIYDEGRHGFFVDRRDPQIFHKVVAPLSTYWRCF